MAKIFFSELKNQVGREVALSGWIYRLRALSKTTFIVLKDATGLVQCVVATDKIKDFQIKLDDVVEIVGKVREDSRSKIGIEVDVLHIRLLNSSGQKLPFNSSSDLTAVGQETLLDYRPMALRNEEISEIFKLQAAIVRGFRSYLEQNHFTEIFTSKIVSGGTEGGTNLFEIKYFDRIAYLAQSPQFYKEYGVCGLERVFETGHVYRAEPHATSRHLTEYYSLDLELGFVDQAESVIEVEKELLSTIFEGLNQKFEATLKRHGKEKLPSMEKVPVWEFEECLERLQKEFGRRDLKDDLDPEAERQLCFMAGKECGIDSVFVVGFPLESRPFYTHPRGQRGAAESFDLLFGGLEITTGGQRLHKRADLENALRAKKIDPKHFEDHLKLFELGMPPHGGLAIGLERLTAQILGLANVRSATMYPRDLNRITP